MAGPSSRDSSFDGEIRVVLVGKTGNGKSSSGNTFLNQNIFTSVLSPASVTSECQKARGTVHGWRLAVIDTPGLFDTKYKENDVVQKLKTCISMSASGPHAFLIVINLTRFTEEEQKSVELIQRVFGPEATEYSMVLFTHGDQLGNITIESYIRKCPKLTRLIRECNGRYHVFNNKSWKSTQVPELFQKMENMVAKNRGSYYTNSMFQEAERAVQESMDKILKANAENKRKHEEALRAELKGEILQNKLKEFRNKYNIQAREKAEKKNKYFFPGLVLAGAEVGLTIGAGAGAVCGPVGIGVGAVVGGLVGSH